MKVDFPSENPNMGVHDVIFSIYCLHSKSALVNEKVTKIISTLYLDFNVGRKCTNPNTYTQTHALEIMYTTARDKGHIV